jgi:hypothetical protein
LGVRGERTTRKTRSAMFDLENVIRPYVLKIKMNANKLTYFLK